jgi:hypothetical protein
LQHSNGDTAAPADADAAAATLAPALERSTYTVQRGTLERPLDVSGRATPVTWYG